MESKVVYMTCLHSIYPSLTTRIPSPRAKATLINRFNPFSRKSLPSTSSTSAPTTPTIPIESGEERIAYIPELCGCCQKTWLCNGVSLKEAKERTLEYRLLFHYHGPLTPVLASGGFMLLSRDRDFTNPLGVREELGVLTNDYLEQEPESYLQQQQQQQNEDRYRYSTVAVSDDDYLSRPLHPPPALSFNYGQDQGQDHLDRLFHAEDLIYLADAPRDEGFRGTLRRAPTRREVRPRDEFVDPDAFEIERLSTDLPGAVGADGFETQLLRGRPDLNKPLPPPPRLDTPTLGARFDSNFPDRFLNRDLCYPRFI